MVGGRLGRFHSGEEGGEEGAEKRVRSRSFLVTRGELDLLSK